MAASHDERDKDHTFTATQNAWIAGTLLDPRLTPFAKNVGCLIAQHLNRKTGYAYPSVADMAAMLGATENGVSGAIKQLESTGRLRVVRFKGRTRHSQYFLSGSNGAQPIAAWYHEHKKTLPAVGVSYETSGRETPTPSPENPNGHGEKPCQPLGHNPLSKPSEEGQAAGAAVWLREGEEIPDGFPGKEAMRVAQIMIDRAGASVDLQRERANFYGFAMIKDRRCRDWFKAWLDWIEDAIARAEAAA